MRVETRFVATLETDNRSLWVLRNPTDKKVKYVLCEDGTAHVESRGTGKKEAVYLVNDAENRVRPELAIEFLRKNGYSLFKELEKVEQEDHEAGMCVFGCSLHNEGDHAAGCICADCSGAELTAEND